jgi:hypothetical protein
MRPVLAVGHHGEEILAALATYSKQERVHFSLGKLFPGWIPDLSWNMSTVAASFHVRFQAFVRMN